MEWTNTYNTLYEFGERLREEYKLNLENAGRNASYALADSINIIVEVGDQEVALYFEMEDYWKFVENGREKGGMPPVSAIERWITAKQIVPQMKDGKKLPTIQQLSWAIAKSIEKNGYQPKGTATWPHKGGYLQDAFNTVFEQFQSELQEAMIADILASEYDRLSGLFN